MPLTRLKSPEAAARWLREWTRGRLTSDSRTVRPGDAFIAWPGHVTDGRRFVPAALAAGAATCLVEDEGAGAFGWDDARIATLPGLKAATGRIADAFFERPSERLALIATTGTNGKTSTAWWMAQALTALGQRCGVVGTLGIGEPPPALPASGGEPPPVADLAAEGEAAPPHQPVAFTGLTTPDPVVLHAALAGFVASGFAACALEASSIGLVEQRLAGARLRVALFTNFTQDHLDYHGSMPAYWAAKRTLFAWPGLAAASLNVDDPKGAELAAELAAEAVPAPGSPLDVWTVSAEGHPAARLRAQGVQHGSEGLAFDVHEAGREAPPLRLASSLLGHYNAGNLLVVLGGLRALGVPLAEAVAALAKVTPVPGRLQRVGGPSARQPVVLVDYAHTPDALAKVLGALRPLAAARGGRLTVLFGCGGDRDPGKRPLMAAVAERLADTVFATSDNPRGEAPAAILASVAAGFARPGAARVIEDRREAIATALREAAPEDVVLLAGKGHESYQEIAGVKHPFSDEAEAERALHRRLGVAA
jgi:UDP-N-acetylmuramoyl-L-alanyl-D-glutamate--2,6-diaminopimelate ligase